MCKKLKLVLSTVILATLVTGAAPMPASSNTATVEAAVVNDGNLAEETARRNIGQEQKASDSEGSTDETTDSSATRTESESEDEKDDLKTTVKEAIEEERYERGKAAFPYMIELVVGLLLIPPVSRWIDYLADTIGSKKMKRILGAIICAVLIPVFVWSWNRMPSNKMIAESIVSETEEATELEMPDGSIGSDVVKTVNPESKKNTSVFESEEEGSYATLLPSVYDIICFMIILVVIPVMFSFFG